MTIEEMIKKKIVNFLQKNTLYDYTATDIRRGINGYKVNNKTWSECFYYAIGSGEIICYGNVSSSPIYQLKGWRKFDRNNEPILSHRITSQGLENPSL